MSRLLKALQKAHKEHVNLQASTDSGKVENSSPVASSDHVHLPVATKSVDLHMIFMGVLIVLMAIGVYLNYNISLNLASTQNGMAAISGNFKAQEERLNKMNDLILQMDIANSGQSKEFLAKIDQLSVSVAGQIEEIQSLSKSQYSELSRTIEVQEKSMAALSSKYDQLERSVSNYADVNNRYVEQLNMLKKKIAEINSVEPLQGQAVNK